MKKKWTEDLAFAEGRKYKSRSEFKRGSGSAYQVARQHGLLEQLYPSKTAAWSDDQILAEGCKYISRRAFYLGSPSAYNRALQRNLLDQLYPSTLRDWSSDNTVLVEGGKYKSRREFQRGPSSSAYVVALQRNLLDLIDFPENNAPSDNDAIYIWRAVGQHYNGNPVYKIGVTSVRLGTVRVEQVAEASGFEFDLICCEPVACKATDLEAKLHILGEDPGYTGFDGATEFRALSDSALYAAISMICGVI